MVPSPCANRGENRENLKGIRSDVTRIVDRALNNARGWMPYDFKKNDWNYEMNVLDTFSAYSPPKRISYSQLGRYQRRRLVSQSNNSAPRNTELENNFKRGTTRRTEKRRPTNSEANWLQGQLGEHKKGVDLSWEAFRWVRTIRNHLNLSSAFLS